MATQATLQDIYIIKVMIFPESKIQISGLQIRMHRSGSNENQDLPAFKNQKRFQSDRKPWENSWHRKIQISEYKPYIKIALKCGVQQVNQEDIIILTRMIHWAQK